MKKNKKPHAKWAYEAETVEAVASASGFAPRAIAQMPAVRSEVSLIENTCLDSVVGRLSVEDAWRMALRGEPVPPVFCRQPNGEVKLALISNVSFGGYTDVTQDLRMARGLSVSLHPAARVRPAKGAADSGDGGVEFAANVRERERLTQVPRRRNKRRHNQAVISVPDEVSGKRGHAEPQGRLVAGHMRGNPLGADECCRHQNGDSTDDRPANLIVGSRGVQATAGASFAKRSTDSAVGRGLVGELPVPPGAPNVDFVAEVRPCVHESPRRVFRVEVYGADNVAVTGPLPQPTNSLIVCGVAEPTDPLLPFVTDVRDGARVPRVQFGRAEDRAPVRAPVRDVAPIRERTPIRPQAESAGSAAESAEQVAVPGFAVGEPRGLQKLRVWWRNLSWRRSPSAQEAPRQ